MSLYATMKTKQFLRKLRRRGVGITTGRGKGTHLLARRGRRMAIIKFHGGKNLSKVYMQLVCKQLGLKLEEL